MGFDRVESLKEVRSRSHDAPREMKECIGSVVSEDLSLFKI